VNDRTLAAVGLNELREMHKDLLPAAQYEENMRRLSATNSTKSKSSARNTSGSDKLQAHKPEQTFGKTKLNKK